MKFTSIFFAASASYIRGSPQMRKNEREICVLYIKYIVI